MPYTEKLRLLVLGVFPGREPRTRYARIDGRNGVECWWPAPLWEAIPEDERPEFAYRVWGGWVSYHFLD